MYDVKTAIIGVENLRFKAEVQFNGSEIVEKYLNQSKKQNSFKQLITEEERKEFLVSFGDHLIEFLGDEIDRIEKDIKTEFPLLKHIDIEVN